MTVRVALVTGASRGIGRAIAERLADDGCQVIGTATTEQGAEAISGLDRQNLEGRALDVRDAESIDALIRKVTETHGAPTILVNNAGITDDNLLLRLSDEQWQTLLETNLGGVMRTCRASLRGMMKARWGRIINIGSVIAATGNAGQSNYAAAKAGVEGFSRSLAREVGSRNITVNVVAPGFIETDMTAGLEDKIRDELIDRVPLQRLGDPADIAGVVAFLASENAGYITGETLHVNGGMYMN